MSEFLTAQGVMDLMRRFRDLSVWVVGDLILDEYLEGEVARISPEAPVQVAKIERTFHRLGGAANVAQGISAMGARVSLCGVVGADKDGATFLAACAEHGIDARAVLQRPDRPTTRKLRIVAQRQQLLRLDWEQKLALTDDIVRELLKRLDATSSPPQALVLSDYAKGVLTPTMLTQLIASARAKKIPILVDPKQADFGYYRGATVVTPNIKELELALGVRLKDQSASAIAAAARPLLSKVGCECFVVTMGDRGLMIVEESGPVRVLQATRREVYDVTGAGDTVLAMLALGLGSKTSLPLSAKLATVAAGIVVGRLGTAVVTPRELANALSLDLGTGLATHEKVVSTTALREHLHWWRLQGKKVVFTNGCFDLLHAGHLALLRHARELGDILIVGVNSDASVKRLKGEERPLVPEAERAQLLAALEGIDRVVVFDQDTPLELIQELQPDVLVKGGDYKPEDVVGRAEVEARGGRVAIFPLVAGRSTSMLLEKLKG